jgi:hypothetical protein
LILLAGLLVFFAIAMIGWRAIGDKRSDGVGSSQYQAGLKEIRRWLDARRARRH